MPAEFEPAQQSYLHWMLAALGLEYAILLAVAALLSFVLTLIVVVRGRGSMAAVALLLLVPVPLLIGVFAAIQGGISAYSVIAMSPTTPQPSEVAAGISTALVAPMVGMLLMVPSYALAALGSLIRSFSADPDRSQRR